MTAAISAAITTIPPIGERSPKNTAVHSRLRAIWTPHHTVGRVVGLARQARHPAIATTTYRTVHTTPNVASGGVKPGFSSVSYQSMPLLVARLPMAATATVATAKMTPATTDSPSGRDPRTVEACTR